MTHAEIDQHDVIDRYLTGRLPAEAAGRFEEHYVACGHCLAQLEASHEVIGNLRAAGTAPSGRWREARSPRRFVIPLPAWGLAAMLAVVVAYVGLNRPAPAPPPAAAPPRGQPAPVIELRSYRAEGQAELAATAGGAFVLRLDLRGLARQEQYRVEMVGESGQPVWSGPASATQAAEALEVRVEGARIESGQFWVRLYEAQGGQLLREFGLAVKP